MEQLVFIQMEQLVFIQMEQLVSNQVEQIVLEVPLSFLLLLALQRLPWQRLTFLTRQFHF